MEVWLHSLKVAQLLRSTAFLRTNQSRSYLNHLVFKVFQPEASKHFIFSAFVLYKKKLREGIVHADPKRL